jgi:hypothetical protein
VPDVILPEKTSPAWLVRLAESDALLTWSSGYATKHAAELVSLDKFAASALPPEALVDFRALALSRNIDIPSDSESNDRLERVLRRSIAYAKWGEEGSYKVATQTDPEIQAAVRAFP